MIDIYKFFGKIPGGLLIVPMFAAAIFNTLFPGAIASAGGLTAAVFSGGTLCFSGFLLFAAGATLNIRTLGKVLRRSIPLTIAKLAIMFVFGFAFMNLFGLDGIWGISAVAFITCLCSCNPGVYMGLMQDYGDGVDIGGFALVNILCLPCFPIVVISSANGGGINPMDIISAVIPFLLGLLLGNLDPKLAQLFRAATPLALPFMGFCFGASINLVSAAKAGLAGVLLSLIYLVINIPILLFTDKVIGRQSGYAGVAWCSVAGGALIVPALLPGEVYAPYMADTIAQVALSIVITAILTPLITKAVVSKWGSPKLKEAQNVSPKTEA